MKTNLENLLTIGECEREFRWSYETVATLIKGGAIRSVKINGRDLIDRQSILDFLHAEKINYRGKQVVIQKR